MARIRTIKPDLFRHELLFQAEINCQLPLRVAFIGLFTCCDKEGRFRWRPRQLKLDILPYDDVDFSRVLDALATRGFVVKYEVNHEYYGCIPSWHRHQHINGKEMPSNLPEPNENNIISATQSESEIKKHRKNKHLISREERVSYASSTSIQSGLNIPRNSQGEKEEEGNRKGIGNGKDECTEPLRDSMPSISTVKSQSHSVHKNSQAENYFVITIPLNDKSEFGITSSQVEEWQELYPAIDVMQTLNKIRGWNISNPKHRKTKNGVLKHVNGWLARDQDDAKKPERCLPHKPILFHEHMQQRNLEAAQQWLARDERNIIDGELDQPILAAGTHT